MCKKRQESGLRRLGGPARFNSSKAGSPRRRARRRAARGPGRARGTPLGSQRAARLLAQVAARSSPCGPGRNNPEASQGRAWGRGPRLLRPQPRRRPDRALNAPAWGEAGLYLAVRQATAAAFSTRHAARGAALRPSPSHPCPPHCRRGPPFPQVSETGRWRRDCNGGGRQLPALTHGRHTAAIPSPSRCQPASARPPARGPPLRPFPQLSASRPAPRPGPHTQWTSSREAAEAARGWRPLRGSSRDPGGT